MKTERKVGTYFLGSSPCLGVKHNVLNPSRCGPLALSGVSLCKPDRRACPEDREPVRVFSLPEGSGSETLPVWVEWWGECPSQRLVGGVLFDNNLAPHGGERSRRVFFR